MSTRSSSFASLALLLSAFVIKDACVSSQTYTYCYDASECANTVVESDNVYCYGYQACYNSEVEANAYLVCGGYYGCYASTLAAGTAMYCSGYYSCYSSEIAGAGLSLYGYGYAAVSYSYIVGDSSGTTSYLYDTRAAYGSELIYFDRIYAYGYYSFGYTYINSAGLTDMQIHLDGYYSGIGSVIYCIDETECLIDCGNAYGSCYATTVICYDSAECSINCDEDCSGGCPTVYNISAGTSLLGEETYDYKSVLPQHLWMETLSAQKKAIRDEIIQKQVEMVNQYGEQEGNEKYREWLMERDAETQRELEEEVANSKLNAKVSISQEKKDNSDMLAQESSRSTYVFGALAILFVVYVVYQTYGKFCRNKNNNKAMQDSGRVYEYQSIA